MVERSTGSEAGRFCLRALSLRATTKGRWSLQSPPRSRKRQRVPPKRRSGKKDSKIESARDHSDLGRKLTPKISGYAVCTR